MRADDIQTLHLQGMSDLTLLAPIRQGRISALDTRTYETRLRMVLDTLHLLRVASREGAMVRPLSDSTDRIRTIHSLRMCILEDSQQLLLSVTFDRPWTTYLRVIYNEVGTLLDLIFCNCDDYVLAGENSFEDYGRWITRARTDTRFFYNNGNLTVDDLDYLQQAERLHHQPELNAQAGAAALAANQLQVSDPALTLQAQDRAQPGPLVKLGMKALSVLYRLADAYPPHTSDGAVLHRAATKLLLELSDEGNAGLQQLLQLPVIQHRFGDALEWLRADSLDWSPAAAALAGRAPSAARAHPVEPTPLPRPDPHDVQGGILTPYSGMSHGAVLMFGIEQAALVDDFLRQLALSTEADAQLPGSAIRCNLGFTIDGLWHLGLDDATLNQLPIEFREGMAQRAGLLGDLRGNHPQQWRLPALNWPYRPDTVGTELPRVQMSQIHLVLQLRTQATVQAGDHELLGHPQHPLHARVQDLAQRAEANGLRLLSVQTTLRQLRAGDALPVGHFGFVDGISQPVAGDRLTDLSRPWDDTVPYGELLLGHRNQQDPLPTSHQPLTHNGSFLVVRKLRQNLATLRAIEASVPEPVRALLPQKLMGRDRHGQLPLLPAGEVGNAFNFDADPQGAQCPFSSHIRRANPRNPSRAPGLRPGEPVPREWTPRILRCGMSYGPTAQDGEAPDTERGLMFMAYNASLAEQFETIQRWLTGGNSSNSYSGQTDPFLGVPQAGQPRWHSVQTGLPGAQAIASVNLDPDGLPPLVQLAWGCYLFMPSVSGLQHLLRQAQQARHSRAGRLPRGIRMPSVEAGLALIQQLQSQPQLEPGNAMAPWKAVLEDNRPAVREQAASVWAAIREGHHGVLRTPYGVLVASRSAVDEVLHNRQQRYSVEAQPGLGHSQRDGYAVRLQQSFGPIYLGMDDQPQHPGCPYRSESTLTNAAIQALDAEAAFRLARDTAATLLARMAAATQQMSSGQARWDVTFDIKEVTEPVLASLSSLWFGLPAADPAEPVLQPGGWDWNPHQQAQRRPRCPGHFTAPSRYVFQPNPDPAVAQFGEQHGKELQVAVSAWVAEQLDQQQIPSAPVAEAAFRTFAGKPNAVAAISRTLIGAMMGFLPTVDGNLRSCLDEWLQQDSFWALRQRLLDQGGAANLAEAEAVLGTALRHTMQWRPVPGLVWRTAIRPHELAGVPIHSGDKIVIGLVSATQAALLAGQTDVMPIFGGNRSTGSSHHPTHACPGYDATMATMLGCLVGLMGTASLRPSSAALTLAMEGPMPGA